MAACTFTIPPDKGFFECPRQVTKPGDPFRSCLENRAWWYLGRVMWNSIRVACLSVLTLSATAACSSDDGADASTTNASATSTGSGTTGTTSDTGTLGSTTSAGSTTGVGGAPATTGTTGSTTTSSAASIGGATTTTLNTSDGTSTTASGGATTGVATTGGATTGNVTSTTGSAPVGAGFTIQVQLASELDDAAPTTVGIVTWSVDVPITSARIDFGIDTNYDMTAPVDLGLDGYRTLLLGMKPETTYHFRVIASDGTTNYGSDDQTVTTGSKPSFDPLTSFMVPNPAAVPQGFFVTAFARGSNTSIAFIFDTDGELVWWYDFGATGGGMSGITRARMSADGQSMWAVRESLQGAPLQRVTMDGLTEQTYDVVASHDITPVTGETMAYLEYGEADCDSIFEIDNAGNTHEVFESTNVTGTPGSIQSCHSNAVRYSMKEDVYTFSDLTKEIAIVNRDGSVAWKLTEKVSGGNSSWGGAQHGHQLTDSSILIFANNGASNGSAAIEYGLDGSLIKQFNSAGRATNFGDVQRLSNGNTIITYSTDGLIQEVDASDTVVLQAEAGSGFGYVSFRDSLYGLPLDIQQ